MRLYDILAFRTRSVCIIDYHLISLWRLLCITPHGLKGYWKWTSIETLQYHRFITNVVIWYSNKGILGLISSLSQKILHFNPSVFYGCSGWGEWLQLHFLSLDVSLTSRKLCTWPTIFIISYINILFITKIAFLLLHMGGRVFTKKTPLETLKYYKFTNMCSFAISTKIL